MRYLKTLGLAVLAALLVLAVTAAAQAYYSSEWTISRIWKFDNVDDVNSFQLLMLNTTSNTIGAASSTYVTFTVDSGFLVIKDLAADNTLPVFGMPTADHAYILEYVEGDVWVKVLNYNSTDGTFTELAGIHISPVADEVVIVPLTSKGLVIMYLGGAKFEFNVTGWNLIALIPNSENTTVKVAEVIEAEIPPETLSAPFSGTEISGDDSRVIEISGSGTLRVWFWEGHNGYDVDFAIFYGNNPDYSSVNDYVPVDTYDKYLYMVGHANMVVFADVQPVTRNIDIGNVGGRVKIVTYPYQGDTNRLGSWKIVYALSSPSTSEPTTTPPPSESTPSAPFSLGSDKLKWLAIGAFAIIVLALIFAGGRRR